MHTLHRKKVSKMESKLSTSPVRPCHVNLEDTDMAVYMNKNPLKEYGSYAIHVEKRVKLFRMVLESDPTTYERNEIQQQIRKLEKLTSSECDWIEMKKKNKDTALCRSISVIATGLKDISGALKETLPTSCNISSKRSHSPEDGIYSKRKLHLQKSPKQMYSRDVLSSETGCEPSEHDDTLQTAWTRCSLQEPNHRSSRTTKCLNKATKAVRLYLFDKQGLGAKQTSGENGVKKTRS
ncbi:hypothetical protein BCR33DRAFT_350191 [Rhizoclosmatium globosum]|uniref:Uncharacterized protein n=1 Tax=Rhizoclosmatium globosum TaxID=329046 RepID=A0A1Y2C3U0_9FUNG|nr:hypothetical protein BCR33DRAFT_350191 [Rhizoclosmatium globosum]|eukprot:ORY40965.1 hypothetical protein BCR33DRAFT_350191 [Rhizoclosmatium globosum]